MVISLCQMMIAINEQGAIIPALNLTFHALTSSMDVMEYSQQVRLFRRNMAMSVVGDTTCHVTVLRSQFSNKQNASFELIHKFSILWGASVTESGVLGLRPQGPFFESCFLRAFTSPFSGGYPGPI